MTSEWDIKQKLTIDTIVAVAQCRGPLRRRDRVTRLLGSAYLFPDIMVSFCDTIIAVSRHQRTLEAIFEKRANIP
jgi:hypothetical protein